MKRVASLAASALLLAACQDVSQPTAASAPLEGPAPLFSSVALDGDAVVPGEVIVKMRGNADAREVGRGHGLALGRMGYAGKFAVMQVERGNERAQAARLAADPRVEFAEPNYLRQPHAVDGRLWAFYNPGGLSMTFTDPADSRFGQPLPDTYTSLNDADEDAAGESFGTFAAGGGQVVIGSVDTGVDFNHPEFTGRLIAGKDWVNNDNDPSDDDGHGTHTSGTMAGTNVGVAGVTGAASNVKIYVQKVCGASGCPTSAIVNAIYAAADYPGMVAMNLSLGGGRESKAEKDAINYAVNTKGVLLIASAGNSGTGTVACPACDPNSISVASTNWRDELSYYSQYGSGLDIAAPGGEMYSNTSDDAGIYSSVPGGYAFYQGTSMAAPQVTGVAAIVASKTGLRGAALRAQLESTTDDLGASGYDTTFGNGRVNAYKAVTTTPTSGGGGDGGGTPCKGGSRKCG